MCTQSAQKNQNRPDLTTVVAAGLVELGALEPDQRATFLAAKGTYKYIDMYIYV